MPPKNKPNILIIYTDEHRFDCLGAYGNTEVKTPNIDALAQNGVVYTNSFCPYPVCTPSRYSMLSGLYVHQHRGWTNTSTLSPRIDTFPRILGQSGYRTKAVGKMHFTPTYLDVGFEEMILAEQCGDGRWDDDYHRQLMELGLVDRIDLVDQVPEFAGFAPEEYIANWQAVPSAVPEQYHSTTWIGQRAIETLAHWDRSGSLLMAGFIQPHHPFNPPRAWAEMYNPDKISLLAGWTDRLPKYDCGGAEPFLFENLGEGMMKKIIAYYYAMVSHIDQQVGRMLDILRQKDIYDDTMIIFTSDHGEYLGFHHMIRKTGYMYDPVVKVPLIVKYPGGWRGGTVCRRMVNNIDLAPTILALAGCPVGLEMKGLDLRNGSDGHEFIFATRGHDEQLMVRSKTRKLILSDADHLISHFYDLQADPLEMNNLYNAPEYQSEIADYKKILSTWWNSENRTDAYVDYDAPLIRQPNVASHKDGHREAIQSYYRSIMDG
ncbi:MAG: sulfatase-like hydrolase/transferase [Actinobacteria bacterium]|nr:sulfatase-like hydrolase/transferase [Actinomycetota bacterium]